MIKVFSMNAFVILKCHRIRLTATSLAPPYVTCSSVSRRCVSGGSPTGAGQHGAVRGHASGSGGRAPNGRVSGHRPTGQQRSLVARAIAYVVFVASDYCIELNLTKQPTGI